MALTFKIMQTIFVLARRNVAKFHRDICSLSNLKPQDINKTSLYVKAKRGIEEIKRLRKFQDKTKYMALLKKTFMLPLSKTKSTNNRCDNQKNDIIDPIRNECICLRRENNRLKERLKGMKTFRINEKIKRKDNTIKALKKTISELKVKLNGPTQSSVVPEKMKSVPVSEKGVQCDSIKIIINDLKSENDKLRMLQKDRDEVITGSKEKEKKLNIRLSSRGRPYTPKFRQVYHEFRSRNVGIHHINPLLKSVLSLVDVAVEDLPSASTYGILTSELEMSGRKQNAECIQSQSGLT